MKFSKLLTKFLLIFFICYFPVELISQEVKQKATRQSSMEAFSKGDYEKAYSEFSELLKIYSKDPLYKYYSAVCLVKLERNTAEAMALMQQALENNSASRPLPSDAIFYLARAQHLNGNYTEASGSYNKYTDQVGKKAAKEQGVPELIQQCTQEKGALQKVEAPTAENIDVAVKPEVETAAVTMVVQAAAPDNSLPSKEVLPEQYSEMLGEALGFQFLADSVNKLVADQKQQVEKLPNEKKVAAKTKIAEMELLAATYQKSADQKYSEAHLTMNPEEETTAEVLQQSDNKDVKISDNHLDTTIVKGSPLTGTVEIYSYFEILSKPVTDQKIKIQIDPVVPEGLIYRIQIAVFRNPVAPVYFKGITPVYGFRNEGSDLKTYYAGMFRRLTDARDALAEVKGKGFKDSFITSFVGTKTVSADRAVVLEKEWGTKPFERVVNKISLSAQADTLPPTLTFRVEVMRVVKPAKPNLIESMKTLAGSRGLDILTLDDKKIAYLIGNFITFESAAEYADLIVRNGFRDAKVVAWLGAKEIPVDTAKQLFENLK